jgi:hypothetical protein
MLENKIFDLNFKILTVIILIKTILILYFFFTNSFVKEYFSPNYQVSQKFVNENKYSQNVIRSQKKFLEFIFNNYNNKVVNKINKFKTKNYLYYLTRFINQNLDPNTFYFATLTKIPLYEISTVNILLEKLTDVIIVKINKLYIIKEVNFFQRSVSGKSYKLDLFYHDEKYQYYIFFTNNLEMTLDTNINIISPSSDRTLLLDTYFYYINYDPIKLKQIRSYISKYPINVEFFTYVQKLNHGEYILNNISYFNILFNFLFLILFFNNLLACINLKKGIYYILLFFNLNFFLVSISNHYSLLSSNMLALYIWLILFKTKFYNSFFVFLTGILSFFLLYFGKLDFYIINFLLVIVSIYISHKIINSITR